MGRQQRVETRGEPRSPASSRGLATEPGGLRGPVEEGVGLVSAPEGQNVLPARAPPEAEAEVDPGHLGPHDHARSEIGPRGPPDSVWHSSGEPGAASVSCRVMEPRTKKPHSTASHNQRLPPGGPPSTRGRGKERGRKPKAQALTFEGQALRAEEGGFPPSDLFSHRTCSLRTLYFLPVASPSVSAQKTGTHGWLGSC